MPKDFIYDIEVLPNITLIGVLECESAEVKIFEISPRVNQYDHFVEWLMNCKLNNYRMIGFNNIGYDYPVIHNMINKNEGDVSWKSLVTLNYRKSRAIIDNNNPMTKFAHTVWEQDHIVEQIDLVKIHHFDNEAKMTSLKRLQFNMRLPTIQEFEIPFDKPIKKKAGIESLLSYLGNDLVSTNAFKQFSEGLVEFRETLSDKYGKSFMNHNDTKIGEDYVVMRLAEEAGDQLIYEMVPDYNGGMRRGKKVKGTSRQVIPIKSFIFDYIEFENPEFQTVLDRLNSMKMFVIDGRFHWNEHDEYPDMIPQVKKCKSELAAARKQLKALIKSKEDICGESQMYLEDEIFDLKTYLEEISTKFIDHKIECTIDGFTFDFGKGGLHGTMRNVLMETTDDMVIDDLDVAGYYVNVGIENKLYPQHLTDVFVKVYTDIRTIRNSHAKGTPENAMMKLAGNGAYGKTNSSYSVLYDPLYTMTTTVNGQLMLCMLWEQLRKIPRVSLIQANTDGITIYRPRDKGTRNKVAKVCREWQKTTKMQLEQALYSRMWVRDGNNYIAEYLKDGKLKSKGAYLYKSLYYEKGVPTRGVEWHKKHSMIVVQKAVEAELVHSIPAAKFITGHSDIYDFFLCTNVTGKSKLEWHKEGQTPEPLQKVSRYLISKEGGLLIKNMPPLKGKVDRRNIGINVGYFTTVHNNVHSDDINDYDINYQFYIDQAEKLLNPFK